MEKVCIAEYNSSIKTMIGSHKPDQGCDPNQGSYHGLHMAQGLPGSNDSQEIVYSCLQEKPCRQLQFLVAGTNDQILLKQAIPEQAMKYFRRNMSWNLYFIF